MAERTELPDKDQLLKLFRMLIGPEEERDDAAAEAVLELHGIDPKTLDEDLRVRLEREVEELRARGEEVPPVMLKALAHLTPIASSDDVAE